MNNLSHTPCRSEHIVSIKAHWLSVLQLWLAGFCTDAHTCGHADARTLAHLTKAKTSSTYLTRFHLFSLLFPGSPICFSFVMQRAVIVQEAVHFLLQEQSAGWEFRLQRGEKNPGRRYVQVLREELQQRRQCTLKLPKPQQCVTTCCDIQCIFSFPSCISPTFYSQRQFFFNTFFFCCRSQLPGTTFVTATKTLLALKSSNCAKLSALPHPLIVEGCASAGNTAPCCNGSYCPPRILFVCAFSTLGFVEENYVFFCSMQVYTVTLCLHMGVSQSPIW